ncbi:hypothetical protein COLO4_17597 [Corchorus olitorius]|uniref:Uncharacterized protein n=1 Tax=Corchorus olitorius TaxID=93759 RepID=A0A1R3JC87_9ROSI|nr:hypothetical protein COLO4_17597 [Corchorus olitorius]
MGHTEETTKTAEYIAISTTETPMETNTKIFHGAAAAVDAPPPSGCSKGKKMNKMKKKKKRGLFLCCSNMQFENEEQTEKALAFLKGDETLSSAW